MKLQIWGFGPKEEEDQLWSQDNRQAGAGTNSKDSFAEEKAAEDLKKSRQKIPEKF